MYKSKASGQLPWLNNRIHLFSSPGAFAEILFHKNIISDKNEFLKSRETLMDLES